MPEELKIDQLQKESLILVYAKIREDSCSLLKITLLNSYWSLKFEDAPNP